MITNNVIHRTLHIRWAESTGTAFTIDHDSKQYLVTARHVVKGIKIRDTIEVFHKNKWKRLGVNVVGIGKDDSDIAVLACSMQLSPTLPLVADNIGIVHGQPVWFLGYPFGWDSGSEQINYGRPVPFVKGGLLSAIVSGNVEKLYLDAHNNLGFSGGPVVFVPSGKPTNELRLAGVISGYPAPLIPIVDHDGAQIKNGAGQPIGYVQENPGIVVAIGIRHAIELIKTNPIGFPLSADCV